MNKKARITFEPVDTNNAAVIMTVEANDLNHAKTIAHNLASLVSAEAGAWYFVAAVVIDTSNFCMYSNPRKSIIASNPKVNITLNVF